MISAWWLLLAFIVGFLGGRDAPEDFNESRGEDDAGY